MFLFQFNLFFELFELPFFPVVCVCVFVYFLTRPQFKIYLLTMECLGSQAQRPVLLGKNRTFVLYCMKLKMIDTSLFNLLHL